MTSTYTAVTVSTTPPAPAATNEGRPLNADSDLSSGNHVLGDLGWAVWRDGRGLRGAAPVTPEMLLPGTEHLRTSVLAAWTDHLAGLLAVDVVGPRVPVTLELDVHLHRPAPGSGTVEGISRVVKDGRSVLVAEVEFRDGQGRPLAEAGASFMLAPDPHLRIPPLSIIGTSEPGYSRLAMPLAERAGCVRGEPGVATLPLRPDGTNASNTLNGGLIALLIEEAVVPAGPGLPLASMGLRYLQAVRTGPARAAAAVVDGLGRVEVRDTGRDDRLAVTAVTRSF